MKKRTKIETEYLGFQSISIYMDTSVSSLRDLFKRIDAPPIYRLPGKILVRKADIDAWLEQFRQEPQDIDTLIDELMKNDVKGRESNG